MVFLQSAEATHIARSTVQRHRVDQLTTIVRGALGLGLLFSASYTILSAPAQVDRLWFVTRSVRAPATTTPELKPTLATNTLSIPSLGITAPILWNIPLRDALNGLQQGVVHIEDTAVPGSTGRTVIVGHSAGYWWNQNSWTKIFALLEHGQPGDLVSINREGTTLTYQITERETVAPTAVEVLTNGPSERNQLALITCTPVGTTLRRLVIYAEPLAAQ